MMPQSIKKQTKERKLQRRGTAVCSGNHSSTYSVCFWRWMTGATCHIAPSDTGLSANKQEIKHCVTKYVNIRIPPRTRALLIYQSQQGTFKLARMWKLSEWVYHPHCCWGNGSFKVQDKTFFRDCPLYFLKVGSRKTVDTELLCKPHDWLFCFLRLLFDPALARGLRFFPFFHRTIYIPSAVGGCQRSPDRAQKRRLAGWLYRDRPARYQSSGWDLLLSHHPLRPGGVTCGEAATAGGLWGGNLTLPSALWTAD